jgi:hypothetical protein
MTRAVVLWVTVLADRAMPEFDIGFAVLESVLGVAIGLLACLLGTWWRITTPVLADPVAGAVSVIGGRVRDP